MAELLRRYLQQEAVQPFVWGRSDCALFLADWVQLCRGVDAAAAFRGRYACQRTAKEACGPLGLAGAIRACAVRAGLKRTRTPKLGAVGVLRGDVAGTCTGAILGPRGWVVKCDRALMCVGDRRPIIAFDV